MGKVIRRVIAVLLCATALILAVLPAGEAQATSTHGDYEYDGATIAKYLGNLRQCFFTKKSPLKFFFGNYERGAYNAALSGIIRSGEAISRSA